jgi:glycosyltransferase involved in cell wall biosynthesis
MNDPQVSIVVPTFRRPSFLARAIESVRAQTITAWEMIVVDDNDPHSESRRETEAVMSGFSTDARIRYERHPENRGGGAARNSGINLAVAPLVAFLDDDDEWHPRKLERQIERLQESGPNVALVYCRIHVIDHDTGAPAPRRGDGKAHTLRDLLKRNTIGSTSCVLCRRSALVEIGGFDETLPSKQDIDLYVRLAGHYDFTFVDETLLSMHRHPGARISKDVAGAIRAHEIFHTKHWSKIEAYPDIMQYRLTALGNLLLIAERFAEARLVLWRAWRARPIRVAILVRVALTYGVPRQIAAAPRELLRRRSRGRDHGDTTASDSQP